MDFPADLAAFLGTVSRGTQLAAQSLVVGGIVFLVGLADPLMARLGPAGAAVLASGRRWTRRASLAFALAVAANTGIGLMSLMGTLDLRFGEAIGADFLHWNVLLMLAALAIALLADAGGTGLPRVRLLAGSLAILAGSVMSSHAAARVDGRATLILAGFVHQGGAAAWIGGIPFLLQALGEVKEPQGRRAIGMRFSHIATAAVVCLLAGALVSASAYIGSSAALVGTSYGVMAAAKAALLAILLSLGLANLLLVRRLAEGGDPSLYRLRRFAEVEIGIGAALMFIAASLASQPPAVDQMRDRATVATAAEIIQQIRPAWPRLTSPPHGQTSIPGGNSSDADAAEAADREWSEFNHHWSGILVLAMGLLAAGERTGKAGWTRHWPLLLLGLAAILFVRADPETWPLGPIPFFRRLGDPEVMQHRLLTLLIAAFAVFEWSVRTGRIGGRATLLFPLLCAIGGTLLLTHSHSLTDIKQRYLIELSHIPMGLLGIIAGWARWLEIRGDPAMAKGAGWVWPVGFIAVGLLLINYRES